MDRGRRTHGRHQALTGTLMDCTLTVGLTPAVVAAAADDDDAEMAVMMSSDGELL